MPIVAVTRMDPKPAFRDAKRSGMYSDSFFGIETKCHVAEGVEYDQTNALILNTSLVTLRQPIHNVATPF